MKNIKKIISLLLIATLTVICFTSCGKENKNKNIVIGTTYVVDKIDPTDGGDPWSLTGNGISETIYTQDREGKLVSHLVKETERKDDHTWILTLKDAKFSDGSPVSAKAFSDCMNDIMEHNELARASAGKILFTPLDENKVKLETERETNLLKPLLCEWTNVMYKRDGNKFIFTGPYKVKSLDPGVKMELEPNEYYDEHAKERKNITIKAFKDENAMKQAFESGEIDMAFTVTPEIAKELKEEGKTVREFKAGYQYFAVTNGKKGVMKDVNVRKALSNLINREDMIKALDGGSVATGFFAHYYDFNGDLKIKEDKKEALDALKASGYTEKNGKIVNKDGKQLTIKMVTYPARPDLKLLMQQTASQLDKVGIKAETKLVENIDTYVESGDYDIIFYAHHTAPTGDPGFALNLFFRTDGGKNTMGYSNPEVDAMLDKMGELPAGKERNELAKNVQKTVSKEYPVILLIDPEWHIAVSEKLKNYEPYCGDYYVVNPELGLK